jgi:hypothetical protein
MLQFHEKKRNVIKKEAKKALKHGDCTIEIEHTWTVNTSDTSKNMGDWNHLKITQYLSNKLGKHEINELQKTAILRTAGSADVKVLYIFNMGNNMTCTINCKYHAYR